MNDRIKENVGKIRRLLPDNVTLVVVTKGRNLDEIRKALDAGATDIGENRVQEAVLKYRQLSAIGHRLSAIKWHLIGHLQTNKVKEAVKIFDLIHSVDSLKLAAEIDKEAGKLGKIQGILIEVNTSAEESKFGIRPQEAADFIKEISGLKNIGIKGLMTVAPIAGDPKAVRPCFRALRELMDKIIQLRLAGREFRVLSMGMSDDFAVAIAEGSNMARIGRAIFEG